MLPTLAVKWSSQIAHGADCWALNERLAATVRAIAVAAPIIGALILALFAASYLISVLLGFPASLGLPTIVRYLGGAVALLGVAMAAWAVKARGAASMIVSTYVTFAKAIRWTPASEMAGRTEPLVISGPQKYTRNPLYFGVVVTVLGWALAGTSSFVFVATVILLLWFTLVMIPMEERELRALFGEEWVRYSEGTPMLIPFTKRKNHSEA